MPWKDVSIPDRPLDLAFNWEGDARVVLNWNPPADTTTVSVRRYAVYRVRSSIEPDFATAIEDAGNLIGVTGETTWTDIPAADAEPYHYAVTAVSANSVESLVSNVVSLEGRAVATEAETPVAFRLMGNYPNPFETNTHIQFQLAQSARVSLTVYNLLGQKMAVILKREWLGSGTHAIPWEAPGHLPGGSYFYTLDLDGKRVTRPMMLVR